MSKSTPKFTHEEKKFLTTIRDDIAARPAWYYTGIDHLQRRFSADVLHAADMKEWTKLKNHPTEIASRRASAANAAWFFTWPDDEPDERDRVERDVYNQ